MDYTAECFDKFQSLPTNIKNKLSVGKYYKRLKEIEQKYIGLDYKKFKEDLADIVWNFLEDVQSKYNKYINDKPYLNTILEEGLNYSLSITQPKIKQVRKVLGILR